MKPNTAYVAGLMMLALALVGGACTSTEANDPGEDDGQGAQTSEIKLNYTFLDPWGYGPIVEDGKTVWKTLRLVYFFPTGGIENDDYYKAVCRLQGPEFDYATAVETDPNTIETETLAQYELDANGRPEFKAVVQEGAHLAAILNVTCHASALDKEILVDELAVTYPRAPKSAACDSSSLGQVPMAVPDEADVEAFGTTLCQLYGFAGFDFLVPGPVGPAVVVSSEGLLSTSSTCQQKLVTDKAIIHFLSCK
jgi:hypothetical protein